MTAAARVPSPHRAALPSDGSAFLASGVGHRRGATIRALTGAAALSAMLGAGSADAGAAIVYSFETIADTGGPFSSFGNISSINDSGTVAFRGSDAGGAGIFTGDGTTTTTIADTSGAFASFGRNPSINDSGTTAFFTTLGAGSSGIFTGPDAVLDKVIATGDPLGGSTVTQINFWGA